MSIRKTQTNRYKRRKPKFIKRFRRSSAKIDNSKEIQALEREVIVLKRDRMIFDEFKPKLEEILNDMERVYNKYTQLEKEDSTEDLSWMLYSEIEFLGEEWTTDEFNKLRNDMSGEYKIIRSGFTEEIEDLEQQIQELREENE